MEEILNNLIREHFGAAVTVILVVLAMLIFIVWNAAIIYMRVKKLPCDNNTSKIDDIISHTAMPCDRHQHNIEENNKAVARIDTTLLYLEKTVDSYRNQNKTLIYTQNHSPLSITEAGRKMIERLGIKAMFDANWQRIKALIDALGSKNPYDIDQFCIRQAFVFPEKFVTEGELDKIKVDAYKTGDMLLSYMKVFAVLARDRYFVENGIEVEDDYVNDNPYANNTNEIEKPEYSI